MNIFNNFYIQTNTIIATLVHTYKLAVLFLIMLTLAKFVIM